VPSDRTMVTELGTGLGTLGHDDLDEVLRARPPVMRSLSPEDWDRLSAVRAGGAYDTEFHAAWLNGRSFLAAPPSLIRRLRIIGASSATALLKAWWRCSLHASRMPGGWSGIKELCNSSLVEFASLVDRANICTSAKPVTTRQ